MLFGSDITWQAAASVDYQLNRKMSLGVGWRYYKVNYDNGDFLYNVHRADSCSHFAPCSRRLPDERRN